MARRQATRPLWMGLGLVMATGTFIGCTGEIQGPLGDSDGLGGPPSGPGPTVPGPDGTPQTPGGPAVTPVPPPPPSSDGLYFSSATRRLTKAELRQSLIDLTGLDLATEVAKFPEDFAEASDVFAFDNKYTHQQPSAALIEAARNLADVVGARVLAEPAAMKQVLTCTPSGPGDEACLRQFFSSFGRRVLRRPLDASELDRYVAKLLPFATEAKDFNRAVSLGVRALLQDVEFLYRTEIGQPVQGIAGLWKLTGTEVATRLSFFLWGTTPDDALITAATTGDRLATPAAIKAAAQRMLQDPRARRGVQRFHGLWLGWERQPPGGALGAAMSAESAALIDKVIFEQKGSWLDLFRAKETYVDGPLAAHYGIAAPAGGRGWTSYGTSGRQGILSHASFLGVERKHTDTSPTMRGQFVRTRLLCQPVPPPAAELMVDVDAVPSEGNCKSERYNMWKKDGCKGCHLMMDPIGFGLENYDRTGGRRDVAPADAGKAECKLDGKGEVTGMANGAFEGVAGLSSRLAESGQVEACLGTQLASFMLGRSPDSEEGKLFARVGERFVAGGRRFDSLLLDVVGLPGFGYRRAE